VRFVIAVCVGLFGLVVGALVGAVLVGTGGAPETGGTAATVGLVAGLVGGYLLGRQTSPPKGSPHDKVDSRWLCGGG
jgi:hypothetical protein